MNTAEAKISRLHNGGVIDLHFDLPLILFLSRPRRNFVATDLLPGFWGGDLGGVGRALYGEDQYVPGQSLRVALDQVALLRAELEATPRLALCKTFAEVEQARVAGRIAP